MKAFKQRAKIGLVGLIIVISSPSAQAHAELISTYPVAMSVISEKPANIVLTFSEAPILAGSFIQIEQPSGVVLGKAKPKLSGTALVTPWPVSIQPGIVLVRWRAVADDGHVSIGSFNFTYKQEVATETATPIAANSNSSRGVAIWAAGITLIVLVIGIAVTTRAKR